MLWAIHMIDNPDVKLLRDRLQPEHSAYMAKKDAQCFFTGPLQADDGKVVGSLWIISAESRAEAEAFLAGEPYTQGGVFRSISIHRTRGAHFHPELAGEVGVKPPPKGLL